MQPDNLQSDAVVINTTVNAIEDETSDDLLLPDDCEDDEDEDEEDEEE